MNERKDTTVATPKDLVERFERLSNVKSWMNFSEFAREGIRKLLEYYEDLNSAGISISREQDQK